MGRVSDFYTGKRILVTGGSGFMGKVLIEKLLYSCPGVERIYLLMRYKKGKTAEARIEEITKSLAFKRIKEECPERFSKLSVVNGDISVEGLGLSDEDRRLLEEEVNVVFHGAATVRFNASLKEAINMNVSGTLRLMKLCVNMKKLIVVVHLSTAFCHVDHDVLEEKVYPPLVDPKYLMQLIEWMDDETLEKITARLMAPHPNSYTYSKRLAEVVVSQYYPQLPIVIVRPSVVCPSVSEPLPGWVDNINGPVGIMIGAGKGVIRSMLCHGEIYCEVVPVDMAINGLLIIAAKAGSTPDRISEIPVYNMTQGDSNKGTWGEILEMGRKINFENPFEVMLWYPNGNIRKNKAIHEINVILFHWLPAILIDGILLLFNQKRFMIRVQRKVQMGLDAIQYFTTRQWKFKNDRLLAIREDLSPEDKKTFNMDFESVERYKYLTDCVLGARHYFLKESPDSLPRSRRMMKAFYVADRIVTILFYVLLIWMIVSYSDTARSILDKTISGISSLPFFRSIK